MRWGLLWTQGIDQLQSVGNAPTGSINSRLDSCFNSGARPFLGEYGGLPRVRPLITFDLTIPDTMRCDMLPYVFCSAWSLVWRFSLFWTSRPIRDVSAAWGTDHWWPLLWKGQSRQFFHPCAGYCTVLYEQAISLTDHPLHLHAETLSWITYGISFWCAGGLSAKLSFEKCQNILWPCSRRRRTGSFRTGKWFARRWCILACEMLTCCLQKPVRYRTDVKARTCWDICCMWHIVPLCP